MFIPTAFSGDEGCSRHNQNRTDDGCFAARTRTRIDLKDDLCTRPPAGSDLLRGHRELVVENLAFRPQLRVWKRGSPRPHLWSRIGYFGSHWLKAGGTGERRSCLSSLTPCRYSIANGSAAVSRRLAVARGALCDLRGQRICVTPFAAREPDGRGQSHLGSSSNPR
jgi:hypothetical protein